MEKAKPQLTIPCSPFFFISVFIICFHCSQISAQTAKTTAVPVGVILDLSSETGMGCMTSIRMALEDFYADDAHKDYSTWVNFTFYDSGGDPSEATNIASNLAGYSSDCSSQYRALNPYQATATGSTIDRNRPAIAPNRPGGIYSRGSYRNGAQPYLDPTRPVCTMRLVEREVEAIMGLQNSSYTDTVVSICDQTQVPFISFSTATSPYSQASYGDPSILIHASPDYSSKSLPIANLTHHFNWTSVVHVYEEYGASIFKSRNATGAEIPRFIPIPWNPSDPDIEDALNLMMASTTRVFLVHVVSLRAIHIFQLADKLGMMSKGFVWIVTSSVGDILDTLQPAILSSMNGVVGFRTTEQSDKERKRLMDFSKTYKERLQKDYNITVNNPTMDQLWAYDAAWAVAMAVEKTKKSNSSFAVPPLNGSLESLTNNILSTSFSDGLAGNFGLGNGQRQFSTYEIVNVVDNVARVIGFWTQQYGITESKSSPAESNYKLKARWPGNLTEPPKSSTYSPTALKIGIPVKSNFNGTLGNFSMSLFMAAADLLPKQFNCTFVNLTSTSNRYEDLMRDSQELLLDGIVGDIIIPEDAAQASFTRPYMEGGVQMVVRIKQDTSSMNMWMFFRPFTLNLWLAFIAFFVFTGLAIWVTEHRINPNYGAEDSSRVERSFRKQLGNALYSAFSTAFYAHDGSLKKNLSRILLIIWLFVVFVLTSSYNASLSAILTVEKLKPTVNSLDDLKLSGGFVGFQEGSNIVRDLLTKTFSFSESQIRSLRTDEYPDALNNGRVSAIFDVGPYLTLFLNQSQNSCNFTIVGPTYQSNGFGFAFQDSILLNDLSQAIFSSEVIALKTKFFNVSGCHTEDNDNESHTLSFKSFGGLFIITAVVSGLMVIISLVRYVHYNKNHLTSILRDNNVAVRDRISGLWRNFLSLESSDPPEGESPVEMQGISKGR